MEPTNEEIVTRLLSSNEILHVKNNNNAFTIKPLYNLGEFLKNVKDMPSPYGDKYVFIK